MMQRVTLIQTLGELEQRTLEVNKANESEENLPNFYAEIITEKSDSWYGEHKDRIITLFYENQTEYISFKGIQIHTKISDYYYYTKSGSQKPQHTFTIKGRLSNGKLLKIVLRTIGTHIILPSIVYAIILLGYTQDASLTKKYWELLNGNTPTFETEGDLLNNIEEIRSLMKEIIPTYPFMELFFQKGLDILVERLKKKLDELDYLK